jgi:hypothetical protein
MTSIKTDDALLRALGEAARRPATASEIQKQRVSFIMGTLGDSSSVTRAQVTQILAAQDGRKSAA